MSSISGVMGSMPGGPGACVATAPKAKSALSRTEREGYSFPDDGSYWFAELSLRPEQ